MLTMDLLQQRRRCRQYPPYYNRSTLLLTLVLVVASFSISEVAAFFRPSSVTLRAETTKGNSLTLLGSDTAIAQSSRIRNSNSIMAKATSSDNIDNEDVPPFVIQEVQAKNLGAAANILADAFSEDLNFIAQRVERMNTYLSLKSRFETFRYAERSGALQCMLVAVDRETQTIIMGFCEVDNRPPGGEINPAPRPYISNLAVLNAFRRKGAATALVLESENIVRGSWGKPRLHLRVEKDNAAARAMYERCGYSEQGVTEDTIISTRTSLLLAKTL
jgi:ribosomal protein S18 acetylase RimI-like enzyme